MGDIDISPQGLPGGGEKALKEMNMPPPSPGSNLAVKVPYMTPEKRGKDFWPSMQVSAYTGYFNGGQSLHEGSLPTSKSQSFTIYRIPRTAVARSGSGKVAGFPY